MIMMKTSVSAIWASTVHAQIRPHRLALPPLFLLPLLLTTATATAGSLSWSLSAQAGGGNMAQSRMDNRNDDVRQGRWEYDAVVPDDVNVGVNVGDRIPETVMLLRGAAGVPPAAVTSHERRDVDSRRRRRWLRNTKSTVNWNSEDGDNKTSEKSRHRARKEKEARTHVAPELTFDGGSVGFASVRVDMPLAGYKLPTGLEDGGLDDSMPIPVAHGLDWEEDEDEVEVRVGDDGEPEAPIGEEEGESTSSGLLHGYAESDGPTERTASDKGNVGESVTHGQHGTIVFDDVGSGESEGIGVIESVNRVPAPEDDVGVGGMIAFAGTGGGVIHSSSVGGGLTHATGEGEADEGAGGTDRNGGVTQRGDHCSLLPEELKGVVPPFSPGDGSLVVSSDEHRCSCDQECQNYPNSCCHLGYFTSDEDKVKDGYVKLVRACMDLTGLDLSAKLGCVGDMDEGTMGEVGIDASGGLRN